MGQFSITHLLLLAIIFLIFFGPSRLPQLGQSLGKAIRGFKQGLNEIDAEVNDVTQNDSRQVNNQLPNNQQHQSLPHYQNQQQQNPYNQTHQGNQTPQWNPNYPPNQQPNFQNQQQFQPANQNFQQTVTENQTPQDPNKKS